MNRRLRIPLFAALAASFVASHGQAQVNNNLEGRTDQGIGRPSVEKFNKASSLVGMPVQNHRNERLGRIEDVVIDLETGRVSYAVLATDRDLDRQQKLVAIPITSLRPARDHDTLMLDVERQRLQRVTGFDRSNWPDARNPRASAFLVLPDAGAPIQAERERGRGSLGRGSTPPERYENRFEQDRFQRLEQAMERDRNRSFYSRYDRGRNYDDTYAERGNQPRRLANRDQERLRVSGEVVSINPENRTMVVRSEGRTVQLVFDDRPVIALKNMRNPSIADIRVGYNVSVGYFRDEFGNNVAKTIIRTTAPEVR